MILAIATLGFFEVLSPYFSPILWAAILAVIFHPLKTYLRVRMGERNGLAALITLLCICLIVFTPLAIIASSLVVETNAVYHKLQHLLVAALDIGAHGLAVGHLVGIEAHLVGQQQHLQFNLLVSFSKVHQIIYNTIFYSVV